MNTQKLNINPIERLTKIIVAIAICIGSFQLSKAYAVTNDRFYFLSEIGGCNNLNSWLDSVPPAHSNATLVIDQGCELYESITLPRRFTLAGVGMDGEGQLKFRKLGKNQAAINIDSIATESASVTIRDLAIYGPGSFLANRDGSEPVLAAKNGRGLDLTNSSIVTINNVRVTGFNVGIYGMTSFSVLMQQCNISTNNTNIYLHRNANSWRIRDTVINQARGWGIDIGGPIFDDDLGHNVDNNDTLISGCRFEANAQGGILARATAAMISHNRFENNGTNDPRSILVESTGCGTRILSNVFSPDEVEDLGTDTQSGFNIHTPLCQN